MACGCIKKQAQAFDFNLESLDCKTLIFTDLSNWMEEEPYILPSKQEVEVTLPSGSIITLNFNPKSVTKFTGEELKAKDCLPNGIYCFKVESCGHIMSRHKAVVCKLECKLDNLIAKASRSEDWDVIQEISNLILSVKINTEIGKHQLATELYKIADKKLTRLDCECPCK